MSRRDEAPLCAECARRELERNAALEAVVAAARGNGSMDDALEGLRAVEERHARELAEELAKRKR